MRYKIKITDIAPDIPKQLIFSKNCYLGVSMNNPFYWGDHIGLLLTWINKRFPKCHITIGDHLHRINEIMANGTSEEEAIQAALKLGDTMLDRFNDELDKIPNHIFTLYRWQDHLDNVATKNAFSTIQSLYDSNQEFRVGINNSSREFLTRRMKRTNDLKVSTETAIGLSIQYLLEELAVFSTLIKRGYAVQVYPGSQLFILKQIARGEIRNINTNLSQGIFLDLKAKKIGN